MILANIRSLKYKYDKAKPIYLIFCWNGYGVLEAKWTGDFDIEGHPRTIHYSDCNGERDLYYIAPWYRESTGVPVGYAFNKVLAENMAKKLNGENK